MKGYYTVALDKPGFPVYFLCPFCQKLHSYPDAIEDAHFQDAGEASQEFKHILNEIEWDFLIPSVFALFVIGYQNG